MRLIFILLLHFSLTCYAQLNESFNDNDFKNNPVWSGTDDYFTVNPNNELQLYDNEARTAYLTTPSQTVEEAGWQIKVKMDFNPSSSNYARIYLASDTEHLPDVHNALFIELGSSKDNICLYKIENGNKELLIEGLTDRLDHPAVDVIVKVKRTENKWTLESNTGAGWYTEGQADAEYNYPSAFFGIYCQYTKTRADKFFFDDISVTGLPYRDRTPPEITDFELINGSQVFLRFNKALDESSISTDAFTLQNSERRPSRV
ncbi:MAG: hypothetical protein MI866_03230 [Bacteroidales bacterium]|nr:hypothetical protein [Bacteroidales bacterium]